MQPRSIRVSSYAVIIDDARILLCRISDQLPESQGAWTLPDGGIEFGESPEEAAIREVAEETGFEIRITWLATVNSEALHFSDRSVHVVRIVYFAEIVGGALRNEAQGSTDLAQWFTLEEANQVSLVEVARLALDWVRPCLPASNNFEIN